MTRARDLSRLSNSNAFSVDASNRVGIGSTIPRADLDVDGTVLVGNDITIQSGIITAVSATFSGNVSVGGTITYEDVTNVDSVGLITARSGIVLTGGNVTLGTGVTISGASANTFTLSTNGPSAVTVDSSGNIVVTGTNTSGSFIPTSSNVPTNGMYLSGTNEISFATNTTSRLVIESDGDINIDSGGVFYDATNNRLGIGTTPDAPLHIKATGGSTNSINTALIVNYESTGAQAPGAGTAIVLRGSSGGGGTANYDQAQIVTSTTGSNNDHGLDFYTRRSFSSGLVKRFSIDEYGCLRNYAVASTPVAIFGFENGESARIDSSGRLLVGVSSTSATNTVVIQGHSGGSTGQGIVQLAVGSATPSSGSQLGKIVFSDNTHTASADINAQRDGGTWSGSSKPTALVFSTTADGDPSPTERMRIDSSGRTVFASNTGSQAFPNATSFVNDAGVGQMLFLANTYGGAKGYVSFMYNSTPVGSITATGTAGSTATGVAYNTTSDYRLKENVVPLTGATDRINQLQVHRFNFIADPDKTVDGFLAHEAQAVVPECVTGEKDAVDDDGNPVYQGIDQSKLVPLLTAALQEALQKIEDLEGRLTAAGL